MALPSRKITRASRQIQCGSRIPQVLEENGVWYSANSLVEPRVARPLPVSRNIPDWKTAALPGLDTSGIYRAADIKRLRAALEAPGASEARTLRRLDVLAGASIDRRTLRDHLEEVTEKVPSIISSWMFNKGYIVGGWFGFAVMLLGCLAVLVNLVRCVFNLRLLGGRVPLSRALILATSEAYTAVKYFSPAQAEGRPHACSTQDVPASESTATDRLAQSSYLKLADSQV